MDLKWSDTTIDISPITTSGVIVPSLNEVAGGTSESERVGRNIEIVEIHVRFSLISPQVTNSTTQPVGDIVRHILYLDKQCNGAAAIPADILDTADLYSFYKPANEGRFEILWDDIIVMNRQSVQVVAARFYASKEYYHRVVKVKVKAKIEFDNALEDLAVMTSNNFGMLLINVQAEQSAVLIGEARIFYFD